MPELRQDPITGRCVIIAPERDNRPQQIDRADTPSVVESPFLEGHERSTPAEVLAFRDPDSEPDGPGWRVRVVPNRYPAVGPPDAAPERLPRDDFYSTRPAVGIHEVVAECPHDETALTRLSDNNVTEILTAWRDRMRQHRADGRIVHVLPFRNSGAQAGASIAHCHSQLIATEFVPEQIQAELAGAKTYFDRTGNSIFAEIVRREPDDGSRVVEATDRFIAFCPFASRFAWEVCILPREQSSCFATTDHGSLPSLAVLLKRILQRLTAAAGDPPYNLVLHSAPFNTGNAPHYRWHVEILPRTAGIAGYELGAGVFLNTVAPEDAARRLRNAAGQDR